MTKARANIPKKVSERVLKEYNHLCAICGGENPQIHHIDGNSANNEILNLLPLCPNHHFSKIHNPTAKIELGILILFRKYRDPLILSPQFLALYKRLEYLNKIENDTEPDKLEMSGKELVDFISVLENGEFYSNQIIQMVLRPSRTGSFSFTGPNYEHYAQVRQHNHEYREMLKANKDKVIELVVELLRFQNWHR